ncbi:MAG: arsenosugar biosynthesis radical SAM protein ArsS [Planctomycetes bacterium]|nr:arsenosugar biosynthesis radical SAM protein ArsS [Planctomycetota bacterium]
MSTIDLPILNGTSFRAKFETELLAAPVIRTLQINIGYVCNLACRHCHVESSPARIAPEDNMSEETARRIADWALTQSCLQNIDITGGSPEMNPNFRWMVEMFHEAGLHIMDRCNPTIIDFVDRKTGRSYEWVPEFLATNQVEVIASMPCYSEENVEKQRGKGAFNASVAGLLKLNAAGYGVDPNLLLNLVYNPVGAVLPPPQDDLQADYKRELKDRFGLVFNELWTITNMPIKRWRHELERTGELASYMSMLINAYNPHTIDDLMCRHQINIDPRGRLYDCDFNQALDMPTPHLHDRFIWELDVDDLTDRVIATDDHCYGCTAGAGSSCGGALA